MRITLTILGEPASKANSRELVTLPRFSPKHKRMMPMAASIKSKKALEYEKAAIAQLPPEARVMFTGPVRVTMKIYYASERPDLDESVVLDVMQAKYSKYDEAGNRELERAGVYVNDRQVREKHIFHAIDAAKPRAEIIVEEIHAGLFDSLSPPVAVERPPRHRKRIQRVTVRADEKSVAIEPHADGNPF